ncbi:hypothetical protein AB0I60_37215 [Actinosynnema sp. NPDC050436]|uniref:hypothetical protein n=1 Tax=Actinosynnema sp. NPDC050436 TaxID=3155659 RepID=UPI0033FC068D
MSPSRAVDPGRAATLAPDSPDLAAMADTATPIGLLSGNGLRPLTDRWSTTRWWTG